jgi:hypothetical protein
VELKCCDKKHFLGNHKELWKILNAFGEQPCYQFPTWKRGGFLHLQKVREIALIQIFVSIL